jgi:hypothetical protein
MRHPGIWDVQKAAPFIQKAVPFIQNPVGFDKKGLAFGLFQAIFLCNSLLLFGAILLNFYAFAFCIEKKIVPLHALIKLGNKE